MQVLRPSPARSRSSGAPESTASEADGRDPLPSVLLLGMGLWSTFSVVDVYTALVVAPHCPLAWLGAWRAAGVLFLGACYLLSRRKGLSRGTKAAVEFVAFGFTGVLTSIQATRLGGLNSPYLQGISLIIFLRGAAWPSRWTRALVVSLVIAATYPIVMAFAAMRDPHIAAQWRSGAELALFFEYYISAFASTAFATITSHRLFEFGRRANEQEQSRSRLFVNLSHDFRTPLSVIRGEAELLERDAASPTGRDGLRRIRRCAEGLADLTEQLLALARLDAGRTQRHAIVFDLVALAREVAAQAQPGQGGAAIVIDGEPTYTEADPSHVGRVLANLVSNALRHARKGGGHVTLVASPAGEPGLVRVDVTDDGPGIPPERRGVIFERFVSFDREGSTASGIGLALARELAELNGGTLDLVEAARTTFRLHLPAGEAAHALPVAASAVVDPASPLPCDVTGGPASPVPRPHLLVVEDHADMRSVLGRLLEERFNVTQVATVADAIAAIAASPPRAVLCDVMLPDGDGYAVLAYLRTRPDLATTPLVLLSALTDEHERVRGLGAGAVDYVAKPFSGEELRHRLLAAVERVENHRAALERQRHEILMEIHDGVSASLARALLQLGSLPGDAPTEARTAAARASILEGIEEVRSILSLLATAPQSWDELVATLRRSTSDACEAAGIDLWFEEERSAAWELVPPTVAHDVSRIAREALTNVLKHARARKVSCRCDARPDGIHLRIEDDGDGVRLAAPGRGLRTIALRAHRCGGVFSSGDRDGGGAFIDVRIPIEQPSGPAPDSPGGGTSHAHGMPAAVRVP